mgnify:CR=1 FL=1
MSETSPQKMRVSINISVEGVGVLEGEFIRFYAPLTVRDLLRIMPIEGFAAKWDYAVYIQVDLKRGAERKIDKISGGDILYWPPGPYLLIAFKEAIPPSQIVRVGRIEKNYERLEKVNPGSRIRITIAESTLL